jgi:hypothetical protein
MVINYSFMSLTPANDSSLVSTMLVILGVDEEKKRIMKWEEGEKRGEKKENIFSNDIQQEFNICGHDELKQWVEVRGVVISLHFPTINRQLFRFSFAAIFLATKEAQWDIMKFRNCVFSHMLFLKGKGRKLSTSGYLSPSNTSPW